MNKSVALAVGIGVGASMALVANRERLRRTENAEAPGTIPSSARLRGRFRPEDAPPKASGPMAGCPVGSLLGGLMGGILTVYGISNRKKPLGVGASAMGMALLTRQIESPAVKVLVKVARLAA